MIISALFRFLLINLIDQLHFSYITFENPSVYRLIVPCFDECPGFFTPFFLFGALLFETGDVVKSVKGCFPVKSML